MNKSISNLLVLYVLLFIILKLNILIIHGTLNGSNAEDMQYNSMSTTMLKQKGFNYIALGHIHKNNFNSNYLFGCLYSDEFTIQNGICWRIV